MRGQAIQAAGDEGYSLARRLPYLSGVFPVAVMREGRSLYSGSTLQADAWVYPLICRPTSFVAVTSSALREPIQYPCAGIHASQASLPKPGVILQDWQKVFQLPVEPGTQTFDVAVVVEVPDQTTETKSIRSPHILQTVCCSSSAMRAENVSTSRFVKSNVSFRSGRIWEVCGAGIPAVDFACFAVCIRRIGFWFPVHV